MEIKQQFVGHKTFAIDQGKRKKISARFSGIAEVPDVRGKVRSTIGCANPFAVVTCITSLVSSSILHKSR